MISSRTTRIAGAAILGTIVGTGPAYAQMSVDTSTDPDTVRNARTIAIETLGVGGTTTEEGVAYYEIEGDTATNIIHPLIPRITGAQVSVRYDLTNMVFTSDNELADASLTVHPTFTPPTTLGAAVTNAIISLRQGGKGGDNFAVYHITAGATAFTDAFRASLDIDELGLAATGTDDTGSIGISLTYSFAGTPTTESLPTIKDALKLAKGISESAMAGTGHAQDNTATTASEYKNFLDGGTSASVGSLEISALDVIDGAPLFTVRPSGPMVGGVGTVTLHEGAATDIMRASPLVFSGDTSFVSDVTLATANTCPSAGAVSTVTKDGNEVTGWKTDLDVNEVANRRFLCIHVDGETNIPNTDAYSVSVDYTPLANAPLAPTGLKKFTLGSISRQGVNVHIPYLTTSDGYNQRLVMRNRGSSGVGYAMTFASEDGVTTVAGADATGTLAPNSTTVLSLRNDDVVTITGGARTSATIALETTGTAIEIATVQVNLSDGSTDTVTYTAQ